MIRVALVGQGHVSTPRISTPRVSTWPCICFAGTAEWGTSIFLTATHACVRLVTPPHARLPLNIAVLLAAFRFTRLHMHALRASTPRNSDSNSSTGLRSTHACPARVRSP
eukprot:354526-Chlamydomonas_euryale.AAC.5